MEDDTLECFLGCVRLVNDEKKLLAACISVGRTSTPSTRGVFIQPVNHAWRLYGMPRPGSGIILRLAACQSGRQRWSRCPAAKVAAPRSKLIRRVILPWPHGNPIVARPPDRSALRVACECCQKSGRNLEPIMPTTKHAASHFQHDSPRAGCRARSDQSALLPQPHTPLTRVGVEDVRQFLINRQ